MSWMNRNFNPRVHTLFMPINVEKYKGGTVPIVMRSKYERSFATWCDKSSSVIYWSNENIKIPYFHPVKKRKAYYYPDFLLKVCTPNGEKIMIIELKPEKETKLPKYSRRKTLLNEHLVYKTNLSKWKACKEYCDKYGYNFMIITNESLKARGM